MTQIRRIDAVFATPRAVIMTMAISLVCIAVSAIAFVTAYQANSKANETAVTQSEQAKQQTAFLQTALCGFVIPIGELGDIPAPQTPAGAALADQLEKIKNGANGTAEYIRCVPQIP